MFWKVLRVVIIAIVIYYAVQAVIYLLNSIDSDLREDLRAWIEKNINPGWLDKSPSAAEIVMKKFSIFT